MAKQVAVSFEDEKIRIVYASPERGRIAVTKTLTLNDGEFDDFLRSEKIRDFTVTCDFKTFYQDVLLFPPVKESLLTKLIDSAIRKKNPDMKDFTAFHMKLGEKAAENKKLLEAFVFAVDNAELNSIAARFSACGKNIVKLSPDVVAMSHIVTINEALAGLYVLCVFEIGMNKIMFLVKDGLLYFKRVAQSLEQGIHDFDVQNINMTLNYCRQNLRLVPAAAALMGGACTNYEATMGFPIPVHCVLFPSSIHFPAGGGEELMDYMAPIASLIPVKGREDGDVLPRVYRRVRAQKKRLLMAIFLLLILCVSEAAYLQQKTARIDAIKKDISSLREGLTTMEKNRRGFEEHSAALQKLMPVINFVNSADSSPDYSKALASLESLRYQNTEIKSVKVSGQSTPLNVSVEGQVNAADLRTAQVTCEGLLGAMKKNTAFGVSSSSCDIMSKNFRLELSFKGD